ncbi:ATP-binding protein [Streptomyces hydrogenans]|uniref:ATP-binding protein n=1 Tax=Streptomyces hydrogenans TaxID=1873719 RepID=UPI0038044680
MTTTLAGPALPEGWRTPEIIHAIKVAALLDHMTPEAVGPPSYRARYVARDTAPRQARQGVTLALAVWGMGHLADTARLLISELVTNALVHTDSRVISMVVTRTGDTAVRIAVMDTDRSELPVPAPQGDDEEHGRGLALVAALADRWGTERVVTGKRVWAEIDTTKADQQ